MIKLNQPVGGASNLTASSKAPNIWKKNKKIQTYGQIDLKNLAPNQEQRSQRSPSPPVQAVWLLFRDCDVNRITWPKINPSSVWKGVTAGDVPSSKQSSAPNIIWGLIGFKVGNRAMNTCQHLTPACEICQIPQTGLRRGVWFISSSLTVASEPVKLSQV